ncbi:MAG: hypothetical protein IJ861_08100 [Clostridia bacterium]|nr:hypothetical protein [Clostridia bacterium]
MAVLSIAEMPKLKEIAVKYGFNIHLHDACGGQAFSLEPGENTDDGIYHALEQFFSEHKMTVRYFDEKKLNFSAK